MITYGFAKDYTYDGDGTLKVKVRVPSIHGPYRQQAGRGKYTLDKDLPWYTSVLMPNFPNEGDVVALQPLSSSPNSQFIIIGMTGGNYHNGTRI